MSGGMVLRFLRLAVAVGAGIMAGRLLPSMTPVYRYGPDLSKEHVIDAAAVLAAAIAVVAARHRDGVSLDVVPAMATLVPVVAALAFWTLSIDPQGPLPGPASLISDVTTIASLHGLKGFLIGLVVWIVACLPSRDGSAAVRRPSTARVVLAFAVAPTAVGAGMMAEEASIGIPMLLVAAAVLSCGVPLYLVVARYWRVTFATCAGGAALAGLVFSVALVSGLEGTFQLLDPVVREILTVAMAQAFLAGCLFWLIAIADWRGMVRRTGRP